MKLLEDRIISSAGILPGGVVRADMFLNHQLDVGLLKEMGKEFYGLFSGAGVTKILTVEASGIALACFAAECFDVPVVFA
ncbi:MAG: xanthine phosphoribosyltransferase, partial [Oscillospiraceae bacterium]|nr:xanthine phosphoribosyltransferase [Oscillospiraceae bacterium]